MAELRPTDRQDRRDGAAVLFAARQGLSALQTAQAEFVHPGPDATAPGGGADTALVRTQMLALAHHAERLAARLRACAARLELRPVELQPASFLAALVGALRQTLDRGLEIRLEVAPGCPSCHADAQGLESALLELVAWARDDMQGAGPLVIEAHAQGGPAADCVAFTVAHRAPRGGSQDGGVGLAAAAGFARQSGGRLVWDCADDGITRASLLLPCRATR